VGLDLGPLAEHALDQVPRQDVVLAVEPGADVLDLRADCQRRVGDQGPRGGRPGEQRIAYLDLR
jgi:hypothetical protein